MMMNDETSNQRWRGWWEEPPRCLKQHMSLNLSVGIGITGSGEDYVGPFRIQGSVNGQVVSFTKRYATHLVQYEGVMVSNKVIRGTWVISTHWCGSFRIWKEQAISHAESVTSTAEKENA